MSLKDKIEQAKRMARALDKYTIEESKEIYKR